MAGKFISVEAAVSSTLSMSVLLGTDVPLVADLVTDNALAVITRAQAQQFLVDNKKKQDACGVRPRTLDSIGDHAASESSSILGRHGSASLCRVERENKMAATYNVLAFKR